MGLYLYCVGPPTLDPPPELRGLDAADVVAVDAAGLRAWVSEGAPPGLATVDRIREHNRVVERSVERVTALPMRFGQWFGSRAGLEEALAHRGPELGRALERVRGALEFGVRVVGPKRRPVGAPPDRTSGRAYLEGLARRRRAAEAARERGRQVAGELRTFLGDLVRDQRVREDGGGSLVSIAHLVDRDRARAYRRRFGQFAAPEGGARFVLTGPWPPYGFMDEQP